MRYLRRVLEIKWSDVVDKKIINVSFCKKINNIRTIDSQISNKKIDLPRKTY